MTSAPGERQGKPTRPVVLMVAPLPSEGIVGGIANGVRLLLESRVSAEVSLRAFDTYRSADRERWIGTRILWQLGAAARFVATVIRERPTIVHVKAASYVNFYQSALYALLARALGRRVILQLHAGDFPAFHDGSSPLRQRIIRASLRVPHRLMALSEGWARYFRELAGVTDVAIVPNALHTAVYAEAKPDRARFAIPEDRLAILFMGTCNRAADDAKGLAVLAEAVARVRRDAPALVLVTAGVADADAVLPPRLGPAGSGWIDVGIAASATKPVLYRSVDLFALPSRFENMPNTLMEAMAAGVPSLACAVGAIPEMMRDGEEGFLVAVDDVDALTARLRELVQDGALRARMGRRAAQVAAEQLDFSLLEERMLAEYTRLIEPRSAAAQAVRIQKA